MGLSLYLHRTGQCGAARRVRCRRRALRPWAQARYGVDRGFGRRIANHASFALSALAATPVGGPADAVIVETPPLLLAGSAIAYSRVKKAALIVNVSDIFYLINFLFAGGPAPH